MAIAESGADGRTGEMLRVATAHGPRTAVFAATAGAGVTRVSAPRGRRAGPASVADTRLLAGPHFRRVVGEAAGTVAARGVTP
ncbi:hypothetical protein ACFZBU_15575 [Embleya sp. NPDC008237]|uniref:hypothetical protein n=1 Tax=Embleya sp. NPDC008237 TaxID=3363978 RepID=UPI0036EF4BA0